MQLNDGFIRQKELLVKLGFSPATLWRKVAQGTFPKPIKLSERISAWNIAEVDEFINSKLK
jgi:predicted DNA-binding transcriptional regulator AlpA